MTQQVYSTDVIKAATLINKLQTLLAWDLAALKSDSFGGYTVEIKMIATSTVYSPSILCSTKDISEWITNSITETIGQLAAMNINIDPILKNYREVGETLLQGNKNPIDTQQST